MIDGKFGAVPLVDFAIAPDGRERRCLGFARAFDDPSMQLAGWYCSAGNEVVDRAVLACALDRFTILSAAGDSKVADLFARAELKRSFCGRRNPILAATPEGRTRSAEPRSVKLRGHRLQWCAVSRPVAARLVEQIRCRECLRIARGAPSAQSADFATQKRGPPPERLFPTAQAGYIVSTEQARRHACNRR